MNIDLTREETKISVGSIKASTFLNGILKYKVLIEGYNSSESSILELEDAIPLFHNGINSKRYSDNSRVLLLSELNKNGSSDFYYIIGEIDDPTKKDTVDPEIPSGQHSLSTPRDPSGILGIGDSQGLVLWSGKTIVNIDDIGFEIKIDSKKIFKSSFNFSEFKNSNSSLSFSNDTSVLKSEGNLSLLSLKSNIYTNSQNLFLNSQGKTSISSPETIKISSSVLLLDGGIVKIKAMSSSAFTKGTTAIDISSLQGNISLATADGDIKISALSPIGVLPPLTGVPNKVSIWLGPSSAKSGSLEIKMSDLTLTHYLAGIKQSSIVLDTGILISNLTMKVDITPTSITIGSKTGSAEPAIKGDAFNDLLSELIDEIGKIKVPTALGPSGIPLNKPELEIIKGKLNSMGDHMSQHVKVT